MADEQDLGSVYRRHWALVRGCALRIVGDTAAADDVTQEVFMRYWAYCEKGGATAQNTSAFLYKSAAHTALNYLRANKRRSTREHAHAPIDGITPEPEAALTVRWLLAQVPEDLAQIAAYHYLEGMEHEEIAELLSMQRRTVGRRLEAFRVQARALLEGPRAEVAP